VLEEVRDPARALADVQGVGLLEIRARGIENDRLPLLELMAQDAGEPGIGALRHAGGVHGRHALTLVEVDIEVLGLDDLEVKLGVLDLVLPEILGDAHPWECHRAYEREQPNPFKHYQPQAIRS
jgi:hypothetical protein